MIIQIKKDLVLGKDLLPNQSEHSTLLPKSQPVIHRLHTLREELPKVSCDESLSHEQIRHNQNLPEIFNFDFDIPQKDKKWIGHGIDITDYFNYGFTEDTFRMYTNKIKILFKKNQLLSYKNLSDGYEQNNILKDALCLSLGGLEIIDNPLLHSFVYYI